MVEKDNLRLYRIIVEESPHGLGSALTGKFHSSMIALFQERFRMRKGELKVKNSDLAAHVLFHLCEGVLRSLDRFKHEVDPRDVMAEIKQLVINYLVGEKTSDCV